MTPARKTAKRITAPKPKATKPKTPPAKLPDTFGQRLLTARLRLGAALGRPIPQDEFAHAVAELIGDTFHQTRLSRLEAGTTRPTLAEVVAAAEVSMQDVLWLAFGLDDGKDSDARLAWLAAYRQRRKRGGE